MLYISAQPDSTYFIWQLEVQLRNFNELGIKKKSIQVLASYDQKVGLNPDFQRFIDDNIHLAQFYTYPDLRDDPKYTVSIRHNALKQHFGKYPELENEILFFHDSDILFSRIPKIENVNDSVVVKEVLKNAQNIIVLVMKVLEAGLRLTVMGRLQLPLTVQREGARVRVPLHRCCMAVGMVPTAI